MGITRQIKVGILTAPHIEFEQRKDTFVLKNVRIGIGFHWDRHEDQEFAGTLEIRNNPDGTQTAINTIDLEDYLCSVISSEMNANSPMELLKAHAVISRSWAIRAMLKPNHEGFHVCADDHCQRYEGLRRMNERAVEAVRATAGQVLINEKMVNDQMVNEICDCRYYKCCGGRTEIWRTCWEDIDVPYIQSVLYGKGVHGSFSHMENVPDNLEIVYETQDKNTENEQFIVYKIFLPERLKIK